MAEWRTFSGKRTCGNCGHAIQPGEWAALFALGKLLRCETCAGTMGTTPPQTTPPAPAGEVSDYGQRLNAAMARGKKWSRIDRSFLEPDRPELEAPVERDPFDGVFS
jgi:hypothetical protein